MKKEEYKKKNEHYTHCDKYGHMKDGCWKLHPDQAPKYFYQEEEKTNATTSIKPK